MLDNRIREAGAFHEGWRKKKVSGTYIEVRRIGYFNEDRSLNRRRRRVADATGLHVDDLETPGRGQGEPARGTRNWLSHQALASGTIPAGVSAGDSSFPGDASSLRTHTASRIENASSRAPVVW